MATYPQGEARCTDGDSIQDRFARGAWQALVATLAFVALLLPDEASAIPAFNRQTGQNCVACHAGGQFPELDAYGRLFKLTGYTLGERALPISAMASASVSKVADTRRAPIPRPISRRRRPILATASLLLGGKVTDNVGAFAQVTYDPYATQSPTATSTATRNADNIDIRYADRSSSRQRD